MLCAYDHGLSFQIIGCYLEAVMILSFFLVEFQMLGVDCFYNNSQLVSWADVVFLCCLPAHLLHICSEIQNAIREHCIIYSLVSTVPLPRYVCTLHIKLDLEAK